MQEEFDLYDVLSYNEANLAIALSNSLTTVSYIKNEKFHFKYFLEYLGDFEDSLNAKTILIENNYLSRSYLNDYAKYYVYCDSQYGKLCKRVHFFAEPFSKDSLEILCIEKNEDAEKLWASYLGYITIKPLPQAKIGTTILKHYESNSKSIRNYTVVRNYTICLLGRELTINSLAFQEQDEVVSSCATIALWASFHKLTTLFSTPIPAPIDITQAAQFANFVGRTLPSIGLDHNQIIRAIDKFGLVTETRTETQLYGFSRAIIYSYAKMGLPVLIGIDIIEPPEEPNDPTIDTVESTEEQGRVTGYHLITIVGYKEEEVVVEPSSDFTLWANRIKSLYAHDDQSGPFSRIKFINTNSPESIEISRWKNINDDSQKYRANISSIFIPLINEIRITFEDVYYEMQLLDVLLESSIKSTNWEIAWEIFITSSNKYKNELRSGKVKPSLMINRNLSISYPKYIWVCRGIVDKNIMLEFLFDASSINTSPEMCIKFNIMNSKMASLMKAILEVYSEEEIVEIYEIPLPYLNKIKQEVSSWNLDT